MNNEVNGRLNKEDMEKLSTLEDILHGINKIDNNFYLVGEVSSRTGEVYEFSLHRHGSTFRVAHGNYEEMYNFLKAFKKTRLVGNEKNIEEGMKCLSMLVSILAYGSHNIVKVMSYEYLEGYEIPYKAKHTMAEHLISKVDKVKRNVYEDSEGCSYNSITFTI